MYKVMVVDDEPIILSGITHMLRWQDIGCTIEGTYRNGKDAYDALSASPADIIITDIKMPVMDGLELLRKCSTDYPDTVFIILTSLEEFRLVKEAIRYNVCEYLVKTELDESLLKNAVLKAEAEGQGRWERGGQQPCCGADLQSACSTRHPSWHEGETQQGGDVLIIRLHRVHAGISSGK